MEIRARACRRWLALLATASAELGLTAHVEAQEEAQRGAPRMFETADQCIACHNGIITPTGQDIPIGSDWRASMMANAARDPYWQATIRREVLDHPAARAEIEAECSTCHMPMARYTAHIGGKQGEVFAHLTTIRGGPLAVAPTATDRLAADGVSCTTCHQIQPEKLGTQESFVGGFVVDTRTPTGDRPIFGPFAVDSGRSRVMHSASGMRPTRSAHVQESELCATCHTLYTHARNGDDEIVGELPEQVPYLEWRHSDYRGEKSCQSCHMPVVAEPVPITGVLGQPRDSVSRHVFRGGNFFVLRMLNRYRAELGVQALPQELELTAVRTVEHLQANSARLAIEAAGVLEGRLVATVAVTNLAGHKLPTAYPSRRVWIHLTVRDRHDHVLFESGAFRKDGSIAGNDNDTDAATYERHHDTIVADTEVQVYEAIMVDHEGSVTTGVTTGIRYAKDNRILPKGFDKASAAADIAVQGRAADDADFAGSGDRIRYSIDVSGSKGPYRVEAELWYQPIAYRWARNLRREDALEIRRFVTWYDEMSAGSAIVLARTAATTRSHGIGASRTPASRDGDRRGMMPNSAGEAGRTGGSSP